MLGLFAFILVFSVVPVPIAKAASAPYFSLTLIAPTSNPVRRQWAQIIQNSFISANIQANLVYMAFGQWLGLLLSNSTCGKGGAPAALPVEGAGAQNCPMPSFANGGWDAGFVGNGGGTVLPDFGTQNVVLYRGASANDFPPNGSNYYWWYNSTYNSLAADYGTNFNAQARLKDAQQMVKIVADQRPGVIIDYPLEVYAWNPAFKPWGTSNAITSTTAGLDWQHYQTGTITTINAAVTGGLDSVNPLPNPAQNSFYDRYLYGIPFAPAEEPDARGSGVYFDAAAKSVSVSADHLTYTVNLRSPVNWQDGVAVTADDYVFTNMATAITAVAYVAGGTTLSIIGNQDSFTFLNGTTDYVNSGVYQHGGSAPWSGAASSVWKSINATAFSFSLPKPYLFADPLVSGGFAMPMHVYEQVPWAQWQTSPLSGFTSGCTNGQLWSSCAAGGLSQNTFKVTWNTARYGGNGSYIAYGPVGDGAYVYHGYNPTTQTGTLVKFAGYYNATGLAALHEFTINTVNIVSIPAKDAAIAAYGNPINFYDGQYTFNKNDATQMAGLGAHVAYVNDPANGWQEMPLNNANPLWGTGTTTPKGQSDPAHAALYAKYVRTAMSYLVPRQQIVQNLLLGLGTPGITEFFPTSGVISPGDIYSGLTYDPLSQATAFGYLAAAGYNTGYAAITQPNQTPTLLQVPAINVTGITLNVPGFFLGNSFTLTGAFPTIPGTADGFWVTLQQSIDGGKTWSPVALGTATGGGAYSISYTPQSTGNQEFRVFFSGIVSTYTSGAAGPLQSGGLSDVGAGLVQSYDFPSTTHQCGSSGPSRTSVCAANSTDIQYSAPTSLNVGTYSDLFSQLATGINNGLTSLAGSTNTAIKTVNTNVGTLSSQISALTAAQASLAKQTDLAALQTTVSNLNSQVSTLTDVAYAALAVAVILGLLAIFLSRRKAS
jgi:ABC-type transport system substrate-binding protein